MQIPFNQAHSIDANRFSIYLPERNCFGEPIPNIEQWIREGAYILTTVTGGATRLAPSKSMWFNKAEGVLVEETTHILFTFFEPAAFLKDIELVSDFISRFGRETMQQSIAVEFLGKVYFIGGFDEPAPAPQLPSSPNSSPPAGCLFFAV